MFHLLLLFCQIVSLQTLKAILVMLLNHTILHRNYFRFYLFKFVYFSAKTGKIDQHVIGSPVLKGIARDSLESGARAHSLDRLGEPRNVPIAPKSPRKSVEPRKKSSADEAGSSSSAIPSSVACVKPLSATGEAVVPTNVIYLASPCPSVQVKK